MYDVFCDTKTDQAGVVATFAQCKIGKTYVNGYVASLEQCSYSRHLEVKLSKLKKSSAQSHQSRGSNALSRPATP
jgi:hypothetical protein